MSDRIPVVLSLAELAEQSSAARAWRVILGVLRDSTMGSERDLLTARINAARNAELALELALYKEELPAGNLTRPTVLRTASAERDPIDAAKWERERHLAPMSELEMRAADGDR